MNEKPEAFKGMQFVPSKPESWRTVDSFIWPKITAKLVREQHTENVDLKATRDRQAAILRRLEEREAELDAEIGRLTKENERLRDELRQSSVDYTRAEIERLREQIKDCDGTIEALQGAVARAAKKVLTEK